MDIPLPSEVKEVENAENAAPAEVVVKNDEPPVEADADQSSDNPPAEESPAVEDSETGPAAENDSGAAAEEESSGAGEEENSGDQESTDEQPEIKVGCCPDDLFIFAIHIVYAYPIVFDFCTCCSLFLLLSYAARNSTSRFPFPHYKSN